MRYSSALKLFIVSTLLLFLISCAEGVQYHGEEVGGGLNFFSWEDELSLGQQVLQDITRSMRLENDPLVTPVLYRVNGNLSTVAVTAGFPDIPWSVYYIDTDDVNAFAAPGGYLFFLRGLLFRLEYEDELAAIMGHEMGHVLARHTTKRLSELLLLQGIVAAAAEAVKAEDEDLGTFFEAAGGIGLFFYSLKYSRDQERQSDRIGFHLMTDAGYNPEGMARAFQRLLDAEIATGGKKGPGFLSTHPATEERIEVAKERAKTIQGLEGMIHDTPEFQKMIRKLKKKSMRKARPAS